VGAAPLNLIYVSHGERMTDVSPEKRRLYASVDAGFIGHNAYLFCASEGLATVFAEPWTIRSSRAEIEAARSAVRDIRADCGNTHSLEGGELPVQPKSIRAKWE
jgi:nitroreductase